MSIFKKAGQCLLVLGSIGCVCLMCVVSVHAQSNFFTGTTIFVYDTAPRSDFTSYAARNSYNRLADGATTRVITTNVNGWNGTQLQSRMIQDVRNNPSTTYLMGSVGHGDPGLYRTQNGLVVPSDYIAAPLGRQAMGAAVENALKQNNTTGWYFEDSCGSGAACSFLNPTDSSAIQGVFASTRPGFVGNDTRDQYGNWFADFGEDFVSMLDKTRKGGADSPDVDKNGVLTAREVESYLKQHNPGTYKVPGTNEDKPMFFKDSATAAKYDLQHRQTFIVSTRYQYVGKQKGDFGPHDELIRPTEALPPYSELVQGLSDQKEQELAINVGERRGAVVSLGSVSAVGAGDYRVGSMCQVNHANPNSKDGVKLPELKENAFAPCTKPLIHNSQNNPGGTFNNPLGGGNNLGGNSLGNLGSNPLLPLLMQGLLGQGLGGGQGGYGNQNPYNNPYTQQRQNCALQGTSSVCGTDGRTYTNICYLQQANVSLRTYGICSQSTPSPSPQISPNASSILTQLTTSGIPVSLLDAIRNTIATMLSNILSGGAVPETVIR